MAVVMALGPVPETIGTLAELVRLLEGESMPSAYTDAMLRFSPSPEEFGPFARWDRFHYTRHCIHASHHHELLLICYEPGQRTSIHDYDSQMAWIKPVVGQVYEERFQSTAGGKLLLKDMKILGPPNVSYMGAGNPIHRHSNPGPGRAMTINLYARPIRRWRIYDQRSGNAHLGGPAVATAE